MSLTSTFFVYDLLFSVTYFIFRKSCRNLLFHTEGNKLVCCKGIPSQMKKKNVWELLGLYHHNRGHDSRWYKRVQDIVIYLLQEMSKQQTASLSLSLWFPLQSYCESSWIQSKTWCQQHPKKNKKQAVSIFAKSVKEIVIPVRALIILTHLISSSATTRLQEQSW